MQVVLSQSHLFPILLYVSLTSISILVAMGCMLVSKDALAFPAVTIFFNFVLFKMAKDFIVCHDVLIHNFAFDIMIKYAKDIPHYFGQSIYLIGVYITRKESVTHQSEPMEFLTLEDETDIYECVLFPDVFKECGDLLHWETLFIIRGTVEESFGVYSVTIEKMGSLQQWVRRLNR